MLKTLRRIIQEVASTQDFEIALGTMVKRVAAALRTDACSAWFLDRRHSEYVLVAAHGFNPQAVGKARMPMDRGLVGLVGEREEPINVDDAPKHPRFFAVSEVGEAIYKAYLGVPIIFHRQLLGVLMVHQRESRRYSEAEEAFLATIATQLAAIVAHAEATGGVARLLDNNIQDEKIETSYIGVPSSPGVGIGLGVAVYPLHDIDAVPDNEPEDVATEIELLKAALAAGREDYRMLGERLHPHLPLEERALFEVYQRMLDTANLGAEIIGVIEQGNWAQGALRQVIQAHVRRIENLEDEYLRERAVDIKDLGRRILAYLQSSERILPVYQKNTILLGETLTAADLAQVPEGCLVGIVSERGSRSSHVAILARAMGIPAIMGVADLPVYDLQNKELIIDGYYGRVYEKPSANLRAEFKALINQEHELNASLEMLRDLPTETKDNHRIKLMVNTGLGSDVSLSLAAGAEGVGLYRTETPFMTRDRFPSGEEQRIIYRQLLTSFSPRPVTMRTLDIGGDKNLPYFPVNEENPFLGWRGIRITLDHPEIFLVQVRAMLRASEGYQNLQIILPMVTDVSEVDEALRLIKKAWLDVQAEKLNVVTPKVGVLIEVPSAIYQVQALVKRVDFLSVGSNDLTQYLLAVDRNNARVANLYDSMHPAVLVALQKIVKDAHQVGCEVSICGEMAGDPMAVLLLVAMGFDSLSMNAAALAKAKWVIRQFTLKVAQQLLKDVLKMESAVMIRNHMELALEKAGLASLIRAGKR